MSVLYNIYSKFIAWVANIRFYTVGIVLIGKTSYNINGSDMRKVLDIIVPGDVLVRGYKNYLGSFFIKGDFSHAGIYVGNNQVLHVMSDGLITEDILTFLRTDRLAVVRFNNQTIVDSAISKAIDKFSEGVEYDFMFDTTSSRKFYCTEFVDYCYNYPIRSLKGEDEIIYPDDFLNYNVFSVLWKKN